MAALLKDSYDLSFAKGLETKTDRKRVQFGSFLALSNSVFTKIGQLTKRNGYLRLPTINDSTVNALSTFKSALTATGESFYTYAADTGSWYNKGPIASVQLDVVPLVRSATSQSQQDVAVTSNGLACSVWIDSDGTSKYQISDSVSSQIVVNAVVLPGTATASPRVSVLGRYFIVTFLRTIGPATHLQYIAIPLLTPASPIAAEDLATNVSSLNATYDGYVANDNLYISWDANDMGGAVKTSYLDQTLLQHAVRSSLGVSAEIISITADTSSPTPTVWVSFFDSSDNLWSIQYGSTLIEQNNTVVTASEPDAIRITSSANDGLNTIFWETENDYPFNSQSSNYIQSATIDTSAVATTPEVVVRSVSLASKSCIVNDNIYLLAAYGGLYQPTYFLLDSEGNVISKLAYSNGGGYPAGQTLPGTNIDDSQVSIGYLLKDLLSPVNKDQGVANTAGIYSQTGINLVAFQINSEPSLTAEIGNNLHLNGGFLWMYDGAKPVEHGFHVWPEDIAVADSVQFTADTTNGSPTLTNVSSLQGLFVGQVLSGTGIPGATTILAFPSGTSITMSANASATNSTVTVTATNGGSVAAQQYYYQVTYEWTDAQGNIHRSAPSVPVGILNSGGSDANILYIPTLRLTYKADPSNVRIVIYRWSTAQQSYYQITSISSPIQNDPSIDYVVYADTKSDSQILGNLLIYTTGGVVENIAAPACADISLYKSRLFLIDSEDKNQLWYSKPVIKGTPVEMSDLFTIYLAPTIGAQGSTGECKVIAAMDDKNIFFKPNAIYYNTGDGPDIAGQPSNGFSEPVFITSTVGSDNPSSIVFQPQGLMFESDKGIWLLGRDLSTNYIGAPVEAFTTDATVLSAENIPGTNQVRFTMDSGITLMYDYYYQQWGSFTNIPAISSTLYQNLHTFINDRGQVFQESPGSYLDGSNPVLMSFTTSWLNFAGVQGYERAYEFYLLGDYISPHKLSMSIAYDYNPSITQNTVITPDNFSPVYGGDTIYGGGSPYGGPSSVEQWRVFLENQKCQAFQITFQEIYDPSYGVAAGAGLTLSGINLVVGLKKKYPTIAANRSSG